MRWKDLELWVGEVKTQNGKNESHTWCMGGMGASFRGRVGVGVGGQRGSLMTDGTTLMKSF